MDEKLLDQAGDEAGTAAAEAIDGKGEAQAEPEGKDAPHSEPAEETFTQSRVNDIVRERLERANRKTLERYGVESLEALDAYKNDPRHKAVSALCKTIRTDRVAVDYEF